jgi:hypothetical protein
MKKPVNINENPSRRAARIFGLEIIIKLPTHIHNTPLKQKISIAMDIPNFASSTVNSIN